MKTVVIDTAGAAALPAARVKTAVDAVLSGQVIAFPTDTVYGLGTSGLDPSAARRLYAVKGRDSRKPLPFLVHSYEEARRWVRFSPVAQALAEKYWPGPLTLVLRPTPEGKRLMLPNAPTLALRVPAHPLTRGLVAASGVPWASSSANISGRPANRDPAAVREAFNGRVACLIDGGLAPGTASTVVDAVGPALRLLREGALSREEIGTLGVPVK